jgi:hypothetical protein
MHQAPGDIPGASPTRLRDVLRSRPIRIDDLHSRYLVQNVLIMEEVSSKTKRCHALTGLIPGSKGLFLLHPAAN